MYVPCVCTCIHMHLTSISNIHNFVKKHVLSSDKYSVHTPLSYTHPCAYTHPCRPSPCCCAAAPGRCWTRTPMSSSCRASDWPPDRPASGSTSTPYLGGASRLGGWKIHEGVHLVIPGSLRQIHSWGHGPEGIDKESNASQSANKC